MIRTYEAIIHESGDIELLEPVKFARARRALVTVLEDAPVESQRRPYGLAQGQFVAPDDFDAPLPEAILREFEGS